MRVMCLVLALALSGCASLYKPTTTVVQLPGGATATDLEHWTSLFSTICGSIIQDKDGKVVGTLPGSCSTPFTLWANSPVNMGLGGLVLGPTISATK